MTTQSVTKYEVRKRAGWITLDSPENRNALSVALVSELSGHLHAAMQDPVVRVVVLTGNGPVFCAGADLKSGGGGALSKSGQRNPFVEILELISEGPKPVITALNGHAFGGGIGLVAASDIALAVEGARFSFSEVRVGVIPAMISVVVLPKLGLHQTLRLFLTGARFGATEALGYQLLHRVVPAAELEAAVEEEIEQIALGGPIAIGEAKRLVRTVHALPRDEAFRYAEERIAELFSSPEAAEGMAAFAAKRPAAWVSEDGVA